MTRLAGPSRSHTRARQAMLVAACRHAGAGQVGWPWCCRMQTVWAASQSNCSARAISSSAAMAATIAPATCPPAARRLPMPPLHVWSPDDRSESATRTTIRLRSVTPCDPRWVWWPGRRWPPIGVAPRPQAPRHTEDRRTHRGQSACSWQPSLPRAVAGDIRRSSLARPARQPSAGPASFERGRRAPIATRPTTRRLRHVPAYAGARPSS